MSYDSSASAYDRTIDRLVEVLFGRASSGETPKATDPTDRIERAIDELLEEGYLIPTFGADGQVTVILGDRYANERCDNEVAVVEADQFGKPSGTSWQLRCNSIDPNPHVHTATIRWSAERRPN